MTYDLDGIHFAPYVPDWMVGPFELSNYTYRDATLTLKVSGQGDSVASLKVNGEKRVRTMYSLRTLRATIPLRSW